MQNLGSNILPPPYSGAVTARKFELYISVVAERAYRNETSPCYGAIKVALQAPERIDDVIYWAVYGSTTATGFSKNNLNRLVLRTVSEYFRDHSN